MTADLDGVGSIRVAAGNASVAGEVEWFRDDGRTRLSLRETDRKRVLFSYPEEKHRARVKETTCKVEEHCMFFAR